MTDIEKVFADMEKDGWSIFIEDRDSMNIIDIAPELTTFDHEEKRIYLVLI